MTTITRRFIFVSVTVSALILSPRPAAAQRTIRFGAGYSDLSTQTSGDVSSSGPTLSLGYLSHADNETVFSFARWADASFGGSTPGATALSLEDRWFPVDASGFAPYVITGIGAFRYTEPAGLLTAEQQKWGFSYIAGFGLGLMIGDDWHLSAEGRLRSDDGDRNIEYRAGVSYGLGPLRRSQAVPGTIEPFIAWLGNLNSSAPYRAATPLGGVRFRRDLTPSRSVAVELGVVTMDPASGEPPSQATRSTMYLMQPTYEMGWAPAWGRPYFAVGPMLAGFIDGPDAGLRGGAQAGFGADFYLSPNVEAGLLTRFSWFQSAAGESQFGLMIGVTLGPRFSTDRRALPTKVPKGD